MKRALLLLAGLVAAAAPAAADDWMKDTAPALKRLVNQMENTADRLCHEYKISLRRADRWLPRGEEAVLWQRLETVQKSLNKLENGVDGKAPLEIERRMADVFRAWDAARDAGRFVRTSRSVRKEWETLGAQADQLGIEHRILRERNRRYTPPPEDRWDPSKEPERFFTRVELEQLRASLLEAEDLSNRLKASLRDRPQQRRRSTPLGGAALADADLRESAFALERHLDGLVQSWLSRGASGLKPELEVALRWAGRVAEQLEDEPASQELLVTWAELVPPLDSLARLYLVDPVAAR